MNYDLYHSLAKLLLLEGKNTLIEYIEAGISSSVMMINACSPVNVLNIKLLNYCTTLRLIIKFGPLSFMTRTYILRTADILKLP